MSVDRVLCRFAYMLMADPAAALTETRRVFRDSGRRPLAVWSRHPSATLWAAIPGKTLVELGLVPPPEEGTPGPFAMGDPERIFGALGRRRLRRAADRGGRDRVELRGSRRTLGENPGPGRADLRCVLLARSGSAGSGS